MASFLYRWSSTGGAVEERGEVRALKLTRQSAEARRAGRPQPSTPRRGQARREGEGEGAREPPAQAQVAQAPTAHAEARIKFFLVV